MELQWAAIESSRHTPISSVDRIISRVRGTSHCLSSTKTGRILILKDGESVVKDINPTTQQTTEAGIHATLGFPAFIIQCYNISD